MKFRRSLLIKFFAVVLLFVILVPVISTLYTGVFFTLYTKFYTSKLAPDTFYPTDQVEKDWKEFAARIAPLSDDEIRAELKKMSENYPDATLFWVDAEGDTQLQLPQPLEGIPDHWSRSEIIAFMKKSYGGDPFTVVALLGEAPNSGFITIQIPRSLTYGQPDMYSAIYPFLWLAIQLAVFILLFWLFFNRIRKRLVRLQNAMHEAEASGIPIMVNAKSKDEIGDLERSYNYMVEQLSMSQQREQEQEQLRRELIANLSHDLRTPLTTIRGHAYQMSKEETLSENGQKSLQLMDEKIKYIDQLFENLLAYTLLSAKKLTYSPARTDLNRLLRQVLAAWYPTLEKEGFDIEIDLPDETIYWELDVQWFQRILDNLIQNVLRYAKSGHFLKVSLQHSGNEACLIIEDRGPGMSEEHEPVGAGIGLSIVEMMTKEMNMTWKIESDENGTRSILCKPPLS